MLVPKPASDARSNRDGEKLQGEADRTESAQIPLELDETTTATVESTFASRNHTNRKAPDNVFAQMNNFANRHDRIFFSITKRRNQT